jgi:hypothetical protein
MGHVALRLLGERGQPVTNQLVSRDPGYTLDAERERSMLQYRLMSQGHDLFKKSFDVVSGKLLLKGLYGDRRIAEPCGQGNSMFGIGRILDEFNQHGVLATSIISLDSLLRRFPHLAC